MEKAVAVKYSEELPAPIILARGKGELAKRIKKIARESAVEIVAIPELTDALIELKVDALIPEQFYYIIAELLVYVRDLKSSR